MGTYVGFRDGRSLVALGGERFAAASGNFEEGVHAFLDKRPPQWRR